MCGSGTFVIEAAEIAGRDLTRRRTRDSPRAAEGFDAAAWQACRCRGAGCTGSAVPWLGPRCGAVAMSRENAERAGVTALTRFSEQAIADLRSDLMDRRGW